MAGMHHVALHARQFESTVGFYRDLLGLRVEWQPDADNVYLTSGPGQLGDPPRDWGSWPRPVSA